MSTAWEPVIGLEVHAQLLTESKLFCGCATAFGAAPNTNVCPVCLGLPGSLPVLNRRAVEMAVRTALALGCTVHRRSTFARKNYFYPDLPKGYQISQYDEPFASNGRLEIEVRGAVRRIGIVRVHLEEDAGKNVHGVGGESLVDLNRAGTPLVEIVSAPDLTSPEEAQVYLRTLSDVLVFLGVNDGNLEQGSFRCDANVSLRPRGRKTLGTRTEIKNVNSFRFVARALEVEIARQRVLLDSGGAVVQETRGFDAVAGKTYSLRSKEEAHDYRYFPEPDLPPLELDDERMEAARRDMPELPRALRQRYLAEGIPAQAAATLSSHPAIAEFFERARRLSRSELKLANWICGEVLHAASIHGIAATFPVSPEQLAELVELVEQGRISGKQAKEVFSGIAGSDRRPEAWVAEHGMRVVGEEGELRVICERLLAAHPEQVAQVRAGRRGVLGFFVGQVMKQTGGAADPKLVSALLEKLIAGPEPS
jgi:aspartyl-tRNA(Asn)/glutamyl-tRNA(Gln) amidotransferase subunit B